MKKEQMNSFEDLMILKTETEYLEEICIELYCVEHSLDYNAASDYGKESIAVSEYVIPLSFNDVPREITNSEELSKRTSDNETTCSRMRYANAMDAYLKRIQSAVEKVDKWTEEKQKEAEKLKRKGRDALRVSKFLVKIRSIHKDYDECVSNAPEASMRTCKNESGERRELCIKKVTKKEKVICDKNALKEATNATKELQREVENPYLKKFIGSLIFSSSFEEFLKKIKNYVHMNYPQYEGLVVYL